MTGLEEVVTLKPDDGPLLIILVPPSPLFRLIISLGLRAPAPPTSAMLRGQSAYNYLHISDRLTPLPDGLSCSRAPFEPKVSWLGVIFTLSTLSL